MTVLELHSLMHVSLSRELSNAADSNAVEVVTTSNSIRKNTGASGEKSCCINSTCYGCRSLACNTRNSFLDNLAELLP